MEGGGMGWVSGAHNLMGIGVDPGSPLSSVFVPILMVCDEM